MENLRKKLLSMRCPLREGAKDEDIIELEKFAGRKLSLCVYVIYKQFDGFKPFEMHEPSQIHIWSINEIVNTSLDLSGWEGYKPIADELIGADIFMSDLSNDLNPILKYNDRSISSPTLLTFWNDFLSGEYNLRNL